MSSIVVVLSLLVGAGRRPIKSSSETCWNKFTDKRRELEVTWFGCSWLFKNVLVPLLPLPRSAAATGEYGDPPIMKELLLASRGGGCGCV